MTEILLGFVCSVVPALVVVTLGVALHYWSPQQRWLRQSRCAACGYDLRALDSHQCPECGEPRRPAETLAPQPTAILALIWIWIAHGLAAGSLAMLWSSPLSLIGQAVILVTTLLVARRRFWPLSPAAPFALALGCCLNVALVLYLISHLS